MVQIYFKMMLSLGQIAYLILICPYNSRIANALEIMNELFYLACVYHMYIFTDMYDNPEFKYSLGWSLINLVLA